MSHISLAEDGNSFILAYYQRIVYTPNDIYKFYDQDNAMIWRQSLPTPEAVPFIQMKDKIMPDIELGTEFAVQDFSYMPTDDGMFIKVQGQLIFEESVRDFDQVFRIQDKNERRFIIYDSLTINNGSKVSDIETVEIARPLKGGKSDRHHVQPLTPPVESTPVPTQQTEVPAAPATNQDQPKPKKSNGRSRKPNSQKPK